MLKSIFVGASLLSAAMMVQPSNTAARYASGAVPGLPAVPQAVGGGQVFLELDVNESGAVVRATPRRTTPPFTQLVVDAVSGWRFSPASEEKFDKQGKSLGSGTVSSKVLVAAFYRQPTVIGPTIGEAPRELGVASASIAYPTAITEPKFNVLSRDRGVVLVEALVDSTGKVASARVIGSAPPFDDAALEAARQWKFSPASGGNRVISSYVYLVFGFPEPITVAH